MLNLSRSWLAPLALTFLLALQIVAVPAASAGRTQRVANKVKASKAKQVRARVVRKRALRSRSTTTSLRQRIKSPLRRTTRESPLGAKPSKQARVSKALAKTRKGAATTRNVLIKRKAAPGKAIAKPTRAGKNTKASRWQASIKTLKAGIEKLKANPQVARVITFATKVSAKMTRTLDGWQARAPPWLASSMSVLRTYTLPSVAAYTFSRVKNDKAFLGTYLVSNSIVSNFVLPGAIAIGMDPVLSTVLNSLTTPLTLAVIVLRERHNRNKAGESISVVETAKLVGREYRDFAKARRDSSSKAAHAALTPARAH